ncbi:hypothetical protein LCGC14_0327730 [marine sediment metagenome]|uniref:Uncharacterized protein n=1 Tax=marine sediment metagenome TaxID=412755 RepID=A0A0F9W4R8_9ZZZZ
MAYASSTEGSSANVPLLIAQGIASTGLGSSLPSTGAAGSWSPPNTWGYKSTHDSSDIAEAGFFTDGQQLGMSLGDCLIASRSTTYIISNHVINAVTSTGVTVSAGLIVSSAS